MLRPPAWVLALAVAACACGDVDTRRVVLRRVAPAADPGCGAPVDARQVIVTALGDFPVAPDTAESFPTGEAVIDIEKFPESTRVLTVQVLGLGGEERAIGRSRVVDFDALEDGAELAVFTAPRRGFCRVNDLATARVSPLVARAGAGVLIAGGFDADGAPVTTVERYDPDRGAFATLEGRFFGDDQLGLLGASMTAVPDGRVVVAGGARDAYQVYHPGDDAFGSALFLERARAHHAAVALGDGRVLLAGGCGALDGDGACASGTALADTSILDVDGGTLAPGPSLAGARIGGAAVLEADGRVLLSGGVDADGIPVARAERIDPGSGLSESINLVTGAPVTMASGAAFAAFAADGSGGQAWVIPPNRQTAAAVATTDPRAGATTTALEDGAILILGGATGAAPEAILYAPTTERFEPLADAPATSRRDHAAIRLDDGTLLIVGGRGDTDEALADAWIYRPDLTNPFTSELAIDVGDAAQTRLLTPSDPAAATLADERYDLAGADTYVIAAGPEFVAPTITARVTSDAGVSILLGFEDAANHTAVRLIPGDRATLVRTRNGIATTLCTGDPVPSLSTPTDIQVTATPTELIATLTDAILTCDLATPIPRGTIGLLSHAPLTTLTTLTTTR